MEWQRDLEDCSSGSAYGKMIGQWWEYDGNASGPHYIPIMLEHSGEVDEWIGAVKVMKLDGNVSSELVSFHGD